MHENNYRHGSIKTRGVKKDNGVCKVGVKRRLMGKVKSMCVWALCVVLGISCVHGSEFPERECCDPVYPPNTATTAAAPVTHPVSKVPPGEFNYKISNLTLLSERP
ncbi:unnamed protein product [Leptidea sinapis]|uniref:Uncharacterized protein n=1 Tax=Leptidea sinapis TaxID=189913 RepID=A0A5E4QLW7_9NEOP|nr:unnamed protein product [Leptidea sinapis]